MTRISNSNSRGLDEGDERGGSSTKSEPAREPASENDAAKSMSRHLCSQSVSQSGRSQCCARSGASGTHQKAFWKQWSVVPPGSGTGTLACRIGQSPAAVHLQ